MKEAAIVELGVMLLEKNGNHVKLARDELKKRYQVSDKNTQLTIIGFFLRASSRQDRKWGEVRDKWQKRGFANPPNIFDSWGL